MVSGGPRWAWSGARVMVCSTTVRHLRVSWKVQLASELKVQLSKACRRPSSCIGLDRRRPLGPNKREFCSLRINLQLSPCESCSPRCLGQVADFSCCPVTWLEAEDDLCHLAP